MTFASGARVGRYEIGRKLGQGGFGILYAARDGELGRDIALKFLRPEHAFRPQLVKRFLQEARAAARISHPGIVTVYESGEVSGTNTLADGTVYIAMELLAGETLAHRLHQNGRLPYRMAIGYCRQIATALAAAHQAGIVHRDLKPQNVFLVPDPEVFGGERVKILDFGIAKLVEDMGSAINTHSMTMLGTPMYMSPEQCKSSARVDARSDIYSLGCILFEMVCGQTPFAGDPGELIAKHQLVPPPTARSINPELPFVLDQLISGMLAKKPDERPQTMSLALDVLSECDERSIEPPSLTDHRSLIANVETTPGSRTVAETPLSRARQLLSSGRVRVALGAAAAMVIGITVGLCTGHKDGGKAARQVAAKLPNDKPAVPAAAAEADAAPTPPAPPATQIADLKVECLQAQVEKRWADLQMCGLKLEEIAPGEAAVFTSTAKTELANEESLNKLELALDAKDFKAAKTAFEEIEESSVFYRIAQTLYSTAKPPTGVAVKVAAPPKNKNAETKKCDAEEIRDQGLREQQRGNHKIALGRFEASLACQKDQYVEKLAFVAACNDRNDAKARAYYAQLTDAQRKDSRKACDKNHVKIPADTCDADALKEEGVNNVSLGQHAAALTKLEASLHCKFNSYVLQLAFMEACAASNSPKAKLFYVRMTPAQQQKFAQMCIRTSTKYQ